MINMRMVCATALLAVLAVANTAKADEQRVARYTQVSENELRDMDPLAVVAQVQFPREFVTTVGDALTYLLQRSGYTMTAADKDAQHLLSLPLPESHRIIGPKKVHNIARTIVGDAYGLCINSRTREIAIAATGVSGTCLSAQLRGE